MTHESIFKKSLSTAQVAKGNTFLDCRLNHLSYNCNEWHTRRI